ncbi:MAG: hypothetical protein ACFCUN_14550 [Hyphomicrobiaceae bacterium]
MKVSKLLASATILTLMMGMASLAPASAASASPTQLKLLSGDQKSQVQKVHCRRFPHTHRRCTSWQGGVCIRWVSYTHRCG